MLGKIALLLLQFLLVALTVEGCSKGPTGNYNAVKVNAKHRFYIDFV